MNTINQRSSRFATSRLLLAGLALICSLNVSRAGFWDLIGLGSNSSTNAAAGGVASLDSLSQDQLIQGLKEALGKGVQNAVGNLGHDGGFLTNLNVKIPMPQKLQSAERTLRLLKQDKLADDFVNTMNHAAEQAVPSAASVFADAVRGMTIADAKSILQGTNDAATQYFRRTTQTNLYARFLPIVKAATDKVGVTASYKRLLAGASGNQFLSGLESRLTDSQSLDLDGYVTDKALDGLFKMVADEEKRIRENPLARTTDVLKQVFGAAAK